MSRKRRCRQVWGEPLYVSFTPDGIASGEPVQLTVDELETIRLLDLVGATQAECADQMGVARTTVTAIYQEARRKVADALVNGRELRIGGGDYVYRPAPAMVSENAAQYGENQPELPEKGENRMRAAVTYEKETGNIFQHFGRTEYFKIFDIEDGQVKSSEVLPTGAFGHGALGGFLAEHDVDVLICGGIGGGAQTAVANAGIKLFGGVNGSADEAARALAEGRLEFDPDVHCDHHGHHHEGEGCGHHGGGCGHHGC